MFLSLTGLKEQLANAKNDAERVKILNQIVEAQRKQLELLDDENEELKKQLKQKEETESINELVDGVLQDFARLEQNINIAHSLIEINQKQ